MKKVIRLLAVDVSATYAEAIVELDSQEDPYALSSRTKAACAIAAELERAGFEAEARFIEILEAGAPPSSTALHGRIHGGFYAVKTKWEELKAEKHARKEQQKRIASATKEIADATRTIADATRTIADAASKISAAVLSINQEVE